MTGPVLNNESMTVRVSVRMETAEAAVFLRERGMTLGEFHPPVGERGFTFADWLKNPLIPARHYDAATLLEHIVSVEGKSASGGVVHTNTAPRSATGPDLNYLLASTADAVAGLDTLVLRVRPVAVAPKTCVYDAGGTAGAMAALGALAHGRAYFESTSLQSGPGGSVLLIVHDTGTELGRARKSHCERLLSKAGIKEAALPGEGVAAPDGAETDVFELYAPYGRSSAVAESAKVLSKAGADSCFLYRYGREGVSFRFPLKRLTAERNKTLIEAGRAARGRGGLMVVEGGAFGTNGETAAATGLYEAVVKNLQKTKA